MKSNYITAEATLGTDVDPKFVEIEYGRGVFLVVVPPGNVVLKAENTGTKEKLLGDSSRSLILGFALVAFIKQHPDRDIIGFSVVEKGILIHSKLSRSA